MKTMRSYGTRPDTFCQFLRGEKMPLLSERDTPQKAKREVDRRFRKLPIYGSTEIVAIITIVLIVTESVASITNCAHCTELVIITSLRLVYGELQKCDLL